MTRDSISEEQRLIELPFTEPLRVQGNRHDEIQGIERWKAVDHETGK